MNSFGIGDRAKTFAGSVLALSLMGNGPAALAGTPSEDAKKVAERMLETLDQSLSTGAKACLKAVTVADLVSKVPTFPQAEFDTLMTHMSQWMRIEGSYLNKASTQRDGHYPKGVDRDSFQVNRAVELFTSMVVETGKIHKLRRAALERVMMRSIIKHLIRDTQQTFFTGVSAVPQDEAGLKQAKVPSFLLVYLSIGLSPDRKKPDALKEEFGHLASQGTRWLVFGASDPEEALHTLRSAFAEAYWEGIQQLITDSNEWFVPPAQRLAGSAEPLIPYQPNLPTGIYEIEAKLIEAGHLVKKERGSTLAFDLFLRTNGAVYWQRVEESIRRNGVPETLSDLYAARLRILIDDIVKMHHDEGENAPISLDEFNETFALAERMNMSFPLSR